MKDVHLALAWASAFLILYYSKDSQPVYARYLALLLVLYGLFLRPNSVPALVPFLYIYIEKYSEKNFLMLRKLTTSLVIGSVFLVAYYVLTYPVLNTKRAYPEYKLKLMDVIGITKLSGQNYIPECITTSSLISYDHKRLMEMYSPATIDHIYWPSNTINYLPPPTENLNNCVSQARKKAILEQPTMYLNPDYALEKL